MNAVISSFTMQKRGNSPQENEDASNYSWHTDEGDGLLRVAAADGSTEGFLSHRWAHLLAKTFCQACDDDLQATIARAIGTWSEELKTYLAMREKVGRPLQWYEEPGFAAGSFASLLGLALRGEPSPGAGVWSAHAVGDSCVFQVRRDVLVACFPYSDPALFSSRPALVSSLPANNDRVELSCCRGDWQSDDRFFVMTDALAQWFLSEASAGREPWSVLRDIDTQEGESFAGLVDRLRDAKAIRNDDTTLVRVDVIG